jgi:hypothetical protein
MRALKIDPYTNDQVLNAIAKTEITVQRVYDLQFQKNYESFLDGLEKSPSEIDRSYAQIHRSMWKEFQSQSERFRKLYEDLKNSIGAIASMAVLPSVSTLQLNSHLTNAHTSIADCKQMLVEGFAKAPKSNDRYEEFQKLHGDVEEAVETVEKKVEHAFYDIHYLIVGPNPTAPSSLELFKRYINELMLTVADTFSLMSDERRFARSIRAFTKIPIEKHFQLQEDLKALLNSSSEPSRDEVQSLIKRMQDLGKEEQKLAKIYIDLQTILQNSPLNKDKALALAKILETKLNSKAQKIQKKCLSISNPAEQTTGTSASQKIPLQGKCWNPLCSSHTKSEKTERSLKKCACCMKAAYCSQECQRQHWPVHRHFCKSSVKPSPK